MTGSTLTSAPTLEAYQRMYRTLREIEAVATMDMGQGHAARLDRIAAQAKAAADAAPVPQEARS